MYLFVLSLPLSLSFNHYLTHTHTLSLSPVSPGEYAESGRHRCGPPPAAEADRVSSWRVQHGPSQAHLSPSVPQQGSQSHFWNSSDWCLWWVSLYLYFYLIVKIVHGSSMAEQHIQYFACVHYFLSTQYFFLEYVYCMCICCTVYTVPRYTIVLFPAPPPPLSLSLVVALTIPDLRSEVQPFATGIVKHITTVAVVQQCCKSLFTPASHTFISYYSFSFPLGSANLLKQP